MKKIFLSVLLALIAICGLLGFAACGGEESDLTFTENGIVEGQMTYGVHFEKNADTRNFEKVKEVEIPENFDKGKVVLIKEKAFKNCASLEKVTIPSSIEKIGAEAFIGTSLRQIIFKGTKAQWDNIEKEEDWKVATSMGLIPLSCTDGEFKA